MGREFQCATAFISLPPDRRSHQLQDACARVCARSDLRPATAAPATGTFQTNSAAKPTHEPKVPPVTRRFLSFLGDDFGFKTPSSLTRNLSLDSFPTGDLKHKSAGNISQQKYHKMRAHMCLVLISQA